MRKIVRVEKNKFVFDSDELIWEAGKFIMGGIVFVILLFVGVAVAVGIV